MFDVVRRMARRDATMAVVTTAAGRWRPAEIIGVISKEHVAELGCRKASSRSAELHTLKSSFNPTRFEEGGLDRYSNIRYGCSIPATE